MTDTNGTKSTNARSNGNGLGPVAREKYEAILQARVQRCIAAQEAKVKSRRDEALAIYLERNEVTNKLAVYRAALENLIAFFGEPDWRYPVWLRDESALKSHPKVEKALDAILREMPELAPVFAELDRLRRFEEQVTEKVWLAGAPEEIAELLQQLGEPAAHESEA